MNAGLKDLFLHRARHNRWANDRMAQALSLLTDRARRRDAGSWFGSVMDIANHMIVADAMWLRRFRAFAPDSAVLADPRLIPADLSWSETLCAGFSEWTEQRAYVDDRLADWFAEFPADRYGESFAYLDSQGTERKARVAAAFDFLFLHQAHHRGQVSQILDEAGLPNNMASNQTYLEDLA